MVQCETCGTEDHFKVVTGFYYCTVCNSQSQHAVEEELELAFETNADASRIFTAGHVVGSRTPRVRANRRLRSYRRLNIYNDLLRRLVDELIKLGAPPRLKVAVMELWFKYIHVLEVDAEPYGKLPPFCLKEEFEMAAKRIKEESFGLKKAAFNHVSMRYRSVYKQRNKNAWYKKHSVLCGYRPSKVPRMEATGLSDIMSGLSTADNGSGGGGNSTSTSSIDGSSDGGPSAGAEDADIPMDEKFGEISGFGFGTLDATGFSFSKSTKEMDSAFEQNHSKSPSNVVEMNDNAESFAFANSRLDDPSCSGVIDVSMEGDEMNMTSAADKSLNEISPDTNQELEGTISLDVDRENVDTQVEDVDLTSTIAYKLKAYMESENLLSLEHYTEPVFQMHSSCLVMLLYLGVVRAKVYHIGILDIYRFIRQRALTFTEARDAVSDELLKWRQNLFFNMTLPDIHPVHSGMGSFVRSTGILCALLDVPELEMPPIEYFIARTGLDLNLPGEIQSMAVKISRDYNLQPSWTLEGAEEFPHKLAKPMPLMELEACAVLLFVLKYLFGIDGTTEYAASLEAEQKSRDEGMKYFVISHWLTQLSRRAHFLRRRGEFYKSHGPSEFEHVRSAAYLVRHVAKRRADFYQHGMVPRRCARFLDDIDVERKLSAPKLSPSSWPLKSALHAIVAHEDLSDPLHLLDDMTDHRVVMKCMSEFPLASRSHARFYVKASRRTVDAAETPSTVNPIAPPDNMITLVTLLAEYCFCSSLRLHRTLLKIEQKIAQA